MTSRFDSAKKAPVDAVPASSFCSWAPLSPGPALAGRFSYWESDYLKMVTVYTVASFLRGCKASRPAPVELVQNLHVRECAVQGSPSSGGVAPRSPGQILLLLTLAAPSGQVLEK